MQEQHFVYILYCNDGFYYVGLTDDLEKDFRAHTEGGHEFTTARIPVEMVYYEIIPSLQDAKNRQQQLRKWSRTKKKA